MIRRRGYIYTFLLGAGLVSTFLLGMQQKCIDKWKKIGEKNRGQFLLMDQWMQTKQKGKRVEEYFTRNGFKRIAIYGMSNIGMCLVRELRNTGIEISYGIDRNAANIYSEIKIVTPDEDMADIDVVVITLVDGFDEACDLLSTKVKCPLLAIEDIINEV